MSLRKDAVAHLRRMSSSQKEEILASGVRIIVSNRVEYGLSSLNVGTFSM